MSIAPHWLHVYQKPAQGNSFIKRYLTVNYRHKINVMGWFDTASCELVTTRVEAERVFSEYVGNRVAVYVDNPAEPIWEGLVNRVSYNAGGLIFTRSLDQMFNRVVVNFDSNAAGTLATTNTTGANNTDSQAIYGIKEGRFKGQNQNSTTATNTANHLRDRVVTELAYPQTSSSFQGGAYLVKLEMIGFYQTLNWEMNTQNRTLTTFATTILQTDLLGNLANGATFLDNTDFSEMDVPGTTVHSLLRPNTNMRVWEAMQTGTEYGDGATQWIIGVTPTRSTGTRRLYYRASNRELKYTARVSDGLRIRNAFGGLVRPWAVQPDGVIRITDVLVGWNQVGEDPRETYMVGVDYDAESGLANWTGEDDVTIDGAFKLFRSQREFNKRFGQRMNTQIFTP